MIAALIMAACGTVPRAFDKSEEPSVEQAIVKGTFTKGVQVNPVEGTARLMSKLLARTTVDSFEPYGLPAGVAPFDASEYVLHGRAKRDKNPRAVPYVTIHWQLSNKEGVVLADLEQPVDATGAEWEFGTPEVIIRVAEDVAHRVAAILAGIAPAQAEAAPDRGIFVTPVDGAPGDGDFVLTRAIAEALKARGTQLTRFKEQAKYVLLGAMQVSPSVQNRQGVRITWRLLKPDGIEVGKAHQENTVPSGTFDTAWAPTARQIAGAAVDGIHEIIQVADDNARQVALGGEPLDVSGTDGELPKPGGRSRILGQLQDHVVPPDAPISPEPSEAASEGERAAKRLAAEVAAAQRSRPKPTDEAPPPEKSVLGSEDAPGAENIGDSDAETFQPPVLPKLSEDSASSFLVAEVAGAPGNGNELLEQALRRVLRARDQNVTDDLRQARFVIRGLVIMSEPKAGNQEARIVWSVEEQGGKPLGSAEQKSSVAAGSLDENWGSTALDVAMGAVIGIQSVLGDKARRFARRLPPAAALPTRPKSATLPWQPGEPIPPPTR